MGAERCEEGESGEKERRGSVKWNNRQCMNLWEVVEESRLGGENVEWLSEERNDSGESGDADRKVEDGDV